MILNCFENDVPKPACTFICGGGYSLSIFDVSRVEIYSRGYPGRTDQRVWIAVEHALNNPNVPNARNVAYIYATPINACNWNSLQLVGGALEVRRELRIETFDQ